MFKRPLEKNPAWESRVLSISSPGGADSAPPPSDLGATKNSEIWHVRRVSQYERADEIAILKIKAFLNSTLQRFERFIICMFLNWIFPIR